VAGSYRLGPVEEGTVVAHHHWGYEVRLHETGDIGTVDPIFVHDDPGIGMNPENWPAVGEIVRVRRQTTTPQGELRLTTRAGDLARPWAEPPDNGMNYQIVEWHRTRGHAQDPALIVSEMDSGRVTRRIVEIYDDGRADLGDATSEPPVETGDTEVNCNPLPSLIMVNSSPEFTGHEVGRECFEALWRAARRQHPELGPEPPAPDPLREADDALTARIRELLEDLLARGECGTMSPHHLLMLTCVQCALARTDDDGRARRAVRLLLDQFMR
jgi:hypothetical protein